MIEKTREALRKKIVDFGGFEKAAEALGCTRENLYNLTSENSSKRPSLDMARAIADLLGIPMENWTAKPKRKTA